MVTNFNDQYQSHFSNNQHYGCARARLFNNYILAILILCVTHAQEFILSFLKTLQNSFMRIFWEARLIHNIMVQMIPQKFSTSAAAMAIIHAEKRAFRPLFAFPRLRLRNIQNNRHAVLIVRPDEAMVGVRGIAANHAVALV